MYVFSFLVLEINANSHCKETTVHFGIIDASLLP